MSSPGKASLYQGPHTKTLASAISGLCHQGSLLATVESHVIIITHAETRHDTTPQGATRSALDSHVVSLKFDTAWAPERLHLMWLGQHTVQQQAGEPLSNAPSDEQEAPAPG